ncbi:MAG: DUF4079 domain-containing protein [Pseudanabaenales cyanobacterium]|nr:DUF4079 domain-containing protein [Pseudanabaenales cyanobacterium]
MDIGDALRLIHPIVAIVYVLPLIGIVTNYAFQTRQRRLKAEAKEKTKIPPTVGLEHVRAGRWLAGSVVGLALLGMIHPIFKTIIAANVWGENPFQVIFIVLMFAATIAALVFLYWARKPLWRGVFATLTGVGLIVLGAQDGVFRRGYEWYISHYYYGMAAALLMILSLAILPDIYRSKAWRRVHICLNIIALLFFIGQGITGTRDLLDIPPGWQENYIFQCDFVNKTCS